MNHTIYWTIMSAILVGLLFGSILSTKEFDAREEPEQFKTLDKIIMGLVILGYSLSLYLAGTEYHNLKKKIKD